eukprot:GHVL01040529.1.p1 GENE.GHVL01040529.1~~GHVL01040529.1.p1  ORF type:complete len:632 (+),score=140.27 GHVL01040529.1:263-2158(+)
MTFITDDMINGVLLSILPNMTIHRTGADDIAQHLEFRIRRIIEGGVKFMYASRRKKLKCDDVEAACEVQNVQVLFGRDICPTSQMVQSPIPNTSIHWLLSKPVQLERLQKSTIKAPGSRFLRVHWIAVNGEMPRISENVTSATELEMCRLISNKQKHKISHVREKQHSVDGQPLRLIVQKDNKRLLQENDLPQTLHTLSQELQIFLKQISTILEPNAATDKPKFVLAGLKTIRQQMGLEEIVPYLCEMIVTDVHSNARRGPIARVWVVTLLTEALICNTHITVAPYTHQLVSALFEVCLAPSLGGNSGLTVHTRLRQKAAHVLAILVSKLSQRSIHPSGPLNEVSGVMMRLISNAESLPIGTLYGALQTLLSLDAWVVKRLLLPHLSRLWRLIRGSETDKNNPTSDELIADSEEKLKWTSIWEEGCMKDDCDIVSQNYGSSILVKDMSKITYNVGPSYRLLRLKAIERRLGEYAYMREFPSKEELNKMVTDEVKWTLKQHRLILDDKFITRSQIASSVVSALVIAYGRPRTPRGPRVQYSISDELAQACAALEDICDDDIESFLPCILSIIYYHFNNQNENIKNPKNIENNKNIKNHQAPPPLAIHPLLEPPQIDKSTPSIRIRENMYLLI